MQGWRVSEYTTVKSENFLDAFRISCLTAHELDDQYLPYLFNNELHGLPVLEFLRLVFMDCSSKVQIEA